MYVEVCVIKFYNFSPGLKIVFFLVLEPARKKCGVLFLQRVTFTCILFNTKHVTDIRKIEKRCRIKTTASALLRASEKKRPLQRQHGSFSLCLARSLTRALFLSSHRNQYTQALGLSFNTSLICVPYPTVCIKCTVATVQFTRRFF